MLHLDTRPGNPFFEPVKCLVWDLDETIWHGRILEGESPRLRHGIQAILKQLDCRGILLSIASTNDHDLASGFLKVFGMIDYFLAPEINFGSKADSLRRISVKLDMDLRHFAFIDDDPFERSLVCKMLPEVRVFDAVEYDNLLTMQCFNPDMITEESLRRRERVRNELARQDAESNAPDLERFLKSCEVRYQFRPAVIADQDRIRELILRTNRMNASGRIFTATELAMLLKSSSHQVFIASMSDRFGEYGIVAAAIATKIADAFLVEGLWLSCRVARRELPHCIYTSLADLSQELGCKSLEISYRATNHNRLALFHMSQYGFKFKENESASDSRILQIMTPFGRRPYPRWIKVN